MEKNKMQIFDFKECMKNIRQNAITARL